MTIRPILDFIFEEKAGVWSSEDRSAYVDYEDKMKKVINPRQIAMILMVIIMRKTMATMM